MNRERQNRPLTFLALFMKSPESGRAKRRLRPVLSEEEIARLCEAFAGDLLEKLSTFPCDRRVIAHAGPIPNVVYQFDVGCWATALPTSNRDRPSFSLYPQVEGDLGQRLENYFRWSFSQGAAKSVVIGSDSPTLPFRTLEEAFRQLDRREAVLGPSEDGGYYLIGMRRFLPALFQEIPWGAREVFEETMKRAVPLRVATLERWYDVDTPEDLRRLRSHVRRMVEHQEREVPFRTHRLLSGLPF